MAQSPKQPSYCTHCTPRTCTNRQCSSLYMWWEGTSRLWWGCEGWFGTGPMKTHPYTTAHRHSPLNTVVPKQQTRTALLIMPQIANSTLVRKWEARSNFTISVTHLTRTFSGIKKKKKRVRVVRGGGRFPASFRHLKGLKSASDDWAKINHNNLKINISRYSQFLKT